MFNVYDLRLMLQPDFLVNYRTGISEISEKNVINSKAWIQTAVNFSKNIETAPYNESLLKSYLSELRSMTVQKPEVFLPRLRKIFAECGIKYSLRIAGYISCYEIFCNCLLWSCTTLFSTCTSVVNPLIRPVSIMYRSLVSR